MITIKKMETDAETRGKAYVHWRSWQEAYAGIVDANYLDGLTLETCERMARRWTDNILIAKDTDRVVGFAAYGGYRGADLENTGEIFAIYVLADHWGQGAGFRLMQEALSLLDRYPRVAVRVLKENKRAIRFYEKCGFRFDGFEDSLQLGSPVTEARMILERAGLPADGPVHTGSGGDARKDPPGRADPLSDDIRYLTGRALWETENLIACVPDALWNRRYDGIPVWKYLYHTLYSMDKWFIDPGDPAYRDPPFHTKMLADLNAVPAEDEFLSRERINGYLIRIGSKIRAYLDILTDDMLSGHPEGCELSRLRLILVQHRHWHRHMGVVYGFLIRDAGTWPYVLNMNGAYPDGPMPNFYDEAQ